MQNLCPNDELLRAALAKPRAPTNPLFCTVDMYKALGQAWNRKVAEERKRSQQGDSSAPGQDPDGR